MVEIVSTVSPVQTTTLKPSAQQSASTSVPDPIPNSISEMNFVSSGIFIDNLQNVAILQYRSSDGEVIRQYPNQSQINAFKAAQQLASSETSSSHHPAASAAAPASEGTSSGNGAAPQAPAAPTSVEV